MSLKPDDRVLVIPLGVRGSVVRMREDGRVSVLADCATQPVVWKRSELAEIKPGHVTIDVEPDGRVSAAYADGHRLPRLHSRGEQGWDD